MSSELIVWVGDLDYEGSLKFTTSCLMPNVQDFRCNPGRKKRNTKEADKFTGNAPKKCED